MCTRNLALVLPLSEGSEDNFFDRATGGALGVTATRVPPVWLVARDSGDGRELLVKVVK